MNVFTILVTDWFNLRKYITFQYLPNNPIYLKIYTFEQPRSVEQNHIWATYVINPETWHMKNYVLLFSFFRLTCSCVLGLFLWVARSHGGHVADGDLIGEYRIVRHSLELNHSVTKTVITFNCIHLCFSRDNMHLWIMIDTGEIC